MSPTFATFVKQTNTGRVMRKTNEPFPISAAARQELDALGCKTRIKERVLTNKVITAIAKKYGFTIDEIVRNKYTPHFPLPTETEITVYFRRDDDHYWNTEGIWEDEQECEEYFKYRSDNIEKMYQGK